MLQGPRRRRTGALLRALAEALFYNGATVVNDQRSLALPHRRLHAGNARPSIRR